jgi:hypothetical protein
MPLASLTANGDFSQSSLSIFGYPDAKQGLAISGWRCCPSSEVETEERVQQPPKIRKTFGGPKGKIDLSGKLDSGI